MRYKKAIYRLTLFRRLLKLYHIRKIRNDRTPATVDSKTGEGTIFAAAREALKKYERNKETAAQLQINWEAESGNVPARRDQTIASSAATSVLQRKAGYDPDINTGIMGSEYYKKNPSHTFA